MGSLSSSNERLDSILFRHTMGDAYRPNEENILRILRIFPRECNPTEGRFQQQLDLLIEQFKDFRMNEDKT